MPRRRTVPVPHGIARLAREPHAYFGAVQARLWPPPNARERRALEAGNALVFRPDDWSPSLGLRIDGRTPAESRALLVALRAIISARRAAIHGCIVLRRISKK